MAGLSAASPPVGAGEFVPARARSLTTLRRAATDCRGCDLYRHATQTVFGEGPADARLVMVGEQPGDVEDREGEPFVGPAGRLLDRAMSDAGLGRADVYLTNAVKHFKFKATDTGKRRIHQTPDRIEIVACRPWLTAEFRLTHPELVVALGAVAAKALLGPAFRVSKQRGVLMPWPEAADRPEDFPGAAGQIMATVHPSSVLRADNREVAYRSLVDDLRVAAAALG
jgi:DNA polymerase